MSNNINEPAENPSAGQNPPVGEPRSSARSRCDACPRRGFPRGKLQSYNWLADIPGSMAESDLVEVVFKNTRKGFYRNTTHLDISTGDMVAVEAAPGHDIGRVTLTGKLVELQMRRAGIKPGTELKRVFRLAKPSDLEKYEEARARENDTMVRARRIAEELKLNMKIGDVEFQGDGNKAIFYYIADERVDFRQLIRILADTFKVRIEMKQIGARQEAGRIGGIGPCGRPLCCASWMTSFVTVGTAAARFQDISLNPQKLAGQCAKLKCCLNFEVDAYMESLKKLPPKEIRLETADNTYFHFKYDVFRREITYSTDKSTAANLVTISAERAFEIIALNKAGEKPESLLTDEEKAAAEKTPYNDILGQDITRFDSKKKRSRGKKGGKESKENRENRDKEKEKKQNAGGNPVNKEGAEKTASRENDGGKEGKEPRRPRRERQKGSTKGFRPEDDTPDGVPAPRRNVEDASQAPDSKEPAVSQAPREKPEQRDQSPEGSQQQRQRRKQRRPGGNRSGENNGDKPSPSTDA